MMKLKCLGSGSSGNCYLLDNGKQTLILDCGLPIKEIKKGLNFDIKRVVGVIVTHSHTDHNKSVNDLINMGIKVYKPYENESDNQPSVKFENFVITSFNLPHNGIRNFGFMVRVNNQRFMYLTDFEYCPYIFSKLKPNHILIECNHQKSLVSRDLANYEHKIRGHCELETCKKFIEVNRTSELRTVILCHLGQETAIGEECKAEVEKVAKCPTYIAKKGIEIELRDTDCPF